MKQGNQEYFYKAYIIITLNQYFKKTITRIFTAYQSIMANKASVCIFYFCFNINNCFRRIFSWKRLKFRNINIWVLITIKCRIIIKNITHRTYIFDCINSQRKKFSKKKNATTFVENTFLGAGKIIESLPKCCRFVGELHRVPYKLIVHH